MMTKKKYRTMIELTANYEQFLKEKKVNNDNKSLFNRVIKKAVTTKQRGSK
jgi:hypothetical protein